MTHRFAANRRNALALFGTLALVPTARAQGAATTGPPWPTRPVRIVVFVGAGSSGDVITRLLAQPLSAALGQPVVVENRPGAGGTIAADAVAKAAPDGYTLVFSNIQPHAVAPAVYASVPYDPLRDFTHVAILAEVPLVLAVSAEGPVQDLAQFVPLRDECRAGRASAPTATANPRMSASRRSRAPPISN